MYKIRGGVFCGSKVCEPTCVLRWKVNGLPFSSLDDAVDAARESCSDVMAVCDDGVERAYAGFVGTDGSPPKNREFSWQMFALAPLEPLPEDVFFVRGELSIRYSNAVVPRGVGLVVDESTARFGLELADRVQARYPHLRLNVTIADGDLSVEATIEAYDWLQLIGQSRTEDSVREVTEASRAEVVAFVMRCARQLRAENHWHVPIDPDVSEWGSGLSVVCAGPGCNAPPKAD